MGAEALGAGYADRGWRFVRLLHPTADIIAVVPQKKNNDPFFLWHFSEVAKWSRRKSSIIKLLQTLFRAESRALLKNHSHSLERELLPGRSCCAPAPLPAVLIAALLYWRRDCKWSSRQVSGHLQPSAVGFSLMGAHRALSNQTSHTQTTVPIHDRSN